MRSCEICGAEFLPKMPHQKVCSDPCRKIKNSRRSAEWARTHSERIRDVSAKSRSKHYVRVMFRGAKNRAMERGLEFDITPDDIVIPKECPILKIPLEVKSKYAPSLDRIDNSKGYVRGNIQVISNKANMMKSDASIQELKRFAEWAQSI